MRFEIIIPSHNMTLAQQAKNCLPGLPVKIFDGTGYPSYAKLINDCIMSTDKEIVIILNHKIRANILDILANKNIMVIVIVNIMKNIQLILY